jgi:hypothetical protein
MTVAPPPPPLGPDETQGKQRNCPIRTYWRVPVKDDEYDKVASKGLVCGGEGRMGFGTGCVRARNGKKPASEKGYEFETDACPTGGWDFDIGVTKWCIPDAFSWGSSLVCIRPLTITIDR